MLDVRK